jgi:hypothetical protein
MLAKSLKSLIKACPIHLIWWPLVHYGVGDDVICRILSVIVMTGQLIGRFSITYMSVPFDIWTTFSVRDICHTRSGWIIYFSLDLHLTPPMFYCSLHSYRKEQCSLNLAGYVPYTCCKHTQDKQMHVWVPRLKLYQQLSPPHFKHCQTEYSRT